MPSDVMRAPGGFQPVIQFSIHADNKVGRLNEIIGLLSVHEVHIMALSILDTTDSSIIRAIVDYPEEAQKLLIEHQFSYVQSELVAVELDSEADIKRVTCALVQAEINIHYTYPFISRPMGKAALAISLEDNDLAADTLARHQLRVIGQDDIAR
ncbi:MAG: acetolactate synthase [Coraliomargarita sp.]|nr:acetolactate synthase [Coraliomargarita sp.]